MVSNVLGMVINVLGKVTNVSENFVTAPVSETCGQDFSGREGVGHIRIAWSYYFLPKMKQKDFLFFWTSVSLKTVVPVHFLLYNLQFVSNFHVYLFSFTNRLSMSFHLKNIFLCHGNYQIEFHNFLVIEAASLPSSRFVHPYSQYSIHTTNTRVVLSSGYPQMQIWK